MAFAARNSQGLCGERGGDVWDLLIFNGFLQGVGADGHERLAEFRAIAVECDAFHAEGVGEFIDRLNVFDVGARWQVDRFGNSPRDERLDGTQHADVSFGADRSGAVCARGVGAIEDREVLGGEMGRAFDRERAADPGIGNGNLLTGTAELLEQGEVRGVEGVLCALESLDAPVGAEQIRGNGEIE